MVLKGVYDERRVANEKAPRCHLTELKWIIPHWPRISSHLGTDARQSHPHLQFD